MFIVGDTKRFVRAQHFSRSYPPYGALAADARALLGFNGELVDPLTGGYHLGNGYRTYDPRLMRFHSPDSFSPFGAGGINAYGYCQGDPVNRRDPSGHAVEDYVLPILAIFTNLLGLFVSGLRFRSLYKQRVAAKTMPDASVTLPDRRDWIVSAVSATASAVGLGIGASRTADPDSKWETWALAGLTVMSLGTTGYEAWKLGTLKPWKPSVQVTNAALRERTPPVPARHMNVPRATQGGQTEQFELRPRAQSIRST